MITATAPGRCGIVGNPTDMYGGSVISISTRERARCEIAPADRLTLSSSGEVAEISRTEELKLCGDRLDIPRAVLQWFHISPADASYSVTLDTDIPMQAGMAGSTALVVAMVGALDRLYGWNMQPWTIAENARKVESRIMKVVCGHQDQHMAVFGGLNYMDFAGKQSLEQTDEEPLAVIEPLAPYVSAIPLLAAHTGIRHHSGSVHQSPRDRWLSGEELVINSYQRIAQLARLGKRAVLAQNWQKLGALMNENHAIISKLGGSGPVNDRLIQVALDAGASGAKLAGAGGGGTILVLMDNPEKVGQALLAADADSLWTPIPSPGLTVEGTL